VSAGRRLLAVADALPVTVLAVIAGAGSFTHIRDTAAEHGQDCREPIYLSSASWGFRAS
jgi:hypothetical protein